ncbi:hypothetical protein KSP40_PGU021797 [Platanthera guangdongensis]|uniref:protein-histidine N-methyltransferase n=1 Tax=Platanthera guangdongensis TaxID=2320717 RepID=A0ABR2M578_9ASPA
MNAKRAHTEDGQSQIADVAASDELGCGHGLPGIFTGLKGAAAIHFQDFNSEVLRFLTVPNAKANLIKRSEERMCPIVRFFAGDWSEVHRLLLHVCSDSVQNREDFGTKDEGTDGYDIILMAETVYALSSLENLYKLIKKCLCRPHGLVYMAGKKHYFGVGGGTRQFLNLVEADDRPVQACCWSPAVEPARPGSFA